MVMIQRCTSPIWALSLCWFRITLFCTIWEIQPDHKVKYLLRHYHFFMNLQVCNFYHISSIRLKTQRRIPSICILSLCRWIVTLQCMLWEKQPGHEVEYFIIFYELTKVYHFYNCSSIQTKTQRSTPSISVLFFCGLIQNTPMYTFGDIAWIRVEYLLSFYHFLWI